MSCANLPSGMLHSKEKRESESDGYRCIIHSFYYCDLISAWRIVSAALFFLLFLFLYLFCFVFFFTCWLLHATVRESALLHGELHTQRE